MAKTLRLVHVPEIGDKLLFNDKEVTVVDKTKYLLAIEWVDTGVLGAKYGQIIWIKPDWIN